jgi:hypothetical protein
MGILVHAIKFQILPGSEISPFSRVKKQETGNRKLGS